MINLAFAPNQQDKESKNPSVLLRREEESKLAVLLLQKLVNKSVEDVKEEKKNG